MSIIDYKYRCYCKERFPLPSEQQVAELERGLKSTLPADYRHFLLEFNGGYFHEPAIPPVTDGCPKDVLAVMHGVEVRSEGHFALGDDASVFDDNDPVMCLPIGGTPMGGLIVMSLWPESAGTILYKQAWGEFFFLADGIEEFFELLTDPEPDE